jgi:predicted phage tail protein
MRAVKVYGRLAEHLKQRVFHAEVASPAEAVRFLCANFPGLDQWLVDSSQDGIGYRVMVGKTKVGEEDLGMFCNDEATISITPVLTGAGGGTGSILAGIGLVAAAILLAPVGGGFLGLGANIAAGSFTLGAAASTAIGAVGAAMILGGVSQLISPTATPATTAQRDPRQLRSFNFSGIQNTSVQGVPLPLVYGKMYVGSIVISAGINTTDI